MCFIYFVSSNRLLTILIFFCFSGDLMTDSICRWHHWWFVNDLSLHIPFPPLYSYRSRHAASEWYSPSREAHRKNLAMTSQSHVGRRENRQNMRDNISRGIKWRNIIWTRNHERKPISGNSMERVKYLIDDIGKDPRTEADRHFNDNTFLRS